MPLYRVQLEVRDVSFYEVEVEADSPDLAGALGREQYYQGCATFIRTEGLDGADISDVEEIKVSRA